MLISIVHGHGCVTVTLRRHGSRWINWAAVSTTFKVLCFRRSSPSSSLFQTLLLSAAPLWPFCIFPLVSRVRYAQVFARCKWEIKLVSKKSGGGGWEAGRGVRVGCLRVAIASEARRNVESNRTKQTLPPVAHCP